MTDPKPSTEREETTADVAAEAAVDAALRRMFDAVEAQELPEPLIELMERLDHASNVSAGEQRSFEED